MAIGACRCLPCYFCLATVSAPYGYRPGLRSLWGRLYFYGNLLVVGRRWRAPNIVGFGWFRCGATRHGHYHLRATQHINHAQS